jgi:hypothetical protein
MIVRTNRLPLPGRVPLIAVVALLLGGLAMAGCTRGSAPSPVIFTGNETKTAEFFLETPGEYQITGQSITLGVSNFELTEPSYNVCKGLFAVPSNVAKACHAKVKGIKHAVGVTGTMKTWWRPKGAKYDRVVETHLEMK